MIGLFMIGLMICLMGVIGSITTFIRGCIVLTQFSISYILGMCNISTNYFIAFVYQCIDVWF